MDIVIQVMSEISIVDIITVVIATVSLILSIVSLIKSIKDSRDEKYNKEIDMTANYYSYPIIKNYNSCELIIPEDSICVISGCIDNTNILILNNNERKDNYYIEANLKFNNKSKVFPTEVLIKKFYLFFGNEQYNNEIVLTENLFFNSIDYKYKNVFIDGNENVTFRLKGIINREIKEKILKSLKKDEIIQIQFDYSFKNNFGVYTDGIYMAELKKTDVKQMGTKKVLGSNKVNYKFNMEKTQCQNKKIYYKKVKKLREKNNKKNI